MFTASVRIDTERFEVTIKLITRSMWRWFKAVQDAGQQSHLSGWSVKPGRLAKGLNFPTSGIHRSCSTTGLGEGGNLFLPDPNSGGKFAWQSVRLERWPAVRTFGAPFPGFCQLRRIFRHPTIVRWIGAAYLDSVRYARAGWARDVVADWIGGLPGLPLDSCFMTVPAQSTARGSFCQTEVFQFLFRASTSVEGPTVCPETLTIAACRWRLGLSFEHDFRDILAGLPVVASPGLLAPVAARTVELPSVGTEKLQYFRNLI